MNNAIAFEIIIHPANVPEWKNKISFENLENSKYKKIVKEYLQKQLYLVVMNEIK